MCALSGFAATCPAVESPIINKCLQLFPDIFASSSQPVGLCNIRPFRIETTGPPICQRAYRTPLTKRMVISDLVDEMLQDGIIRPYNSPWASPVTLVPKSDGSTRFCVDFRKLNSVTKKDCWPLPRICDIVDTMGQSKIFSTMDLKSAYHQIPVHPDDIEKTAFICHRGLYEFIRMPFGLANAPACLQRIMDYIFGDLIGRSVMIYLDDIVVFTKTEEEHAIVLQEVFSRLRKYGLRLKASKCNFGRHQVKLLGFILSEKGQAADPEKTKAISSLPPPRTVKQVRSFLGMTGYYRHCIPNYAKIANPLVQLTKKNRRFSWTQIHQTAFQSLKELLTSNYVMSHPDPQLPYKLYTDASDTCVGAILVQTKADGVEHVIQYVSHQLTRTQQRWATIEKEAYAVVYAITKLRPYLYGASFHVYTDHKPLTSLFTKQMVNTKIQRWAILLAEYGATISYRKGKHNIRADMLSRIPAEVAVIDVEEPFVLPPTDIPEVPTPDQEDFRQDNINPVQLQRLQRKEFPELYLEANNDDSTYVTINGLLYSIALPSCRAPDYPRIVLPQELRHQVMFRAHKEVGHSSVPKTLANIIQAYVWPGMRRDIVTFIKKCSVCQIYAKQKDRVEMGDMPIPAYPMQIIGVDLIGPFVESTRGNKYALTIVDHCSGWGEAIPIPNKRAETVLNAFHNEFIPRHGVPHILISDSGTEFTSREWTNYMANLKIDHRRCTPQHPQSNGKTERLNRTLKELLQKAVNNQPSTWENHLGSALQAQHVSVHASTGFTPFFIMYGRHPREPLNFLLHNDLPTYQFGPRLAEMTDAFKTARIQTEATRTWNRNRISKKANASLVHVGDTAVLKVPEPVTFSSQWEPRYEVIRVKGTTCVLRHQLTGQTKSVHREKVRIVDPNISWDNIQPRPTRYTRKQMPTPPTPSSDDPTPQLINTTPPPSAHLDDQCPSDTLLANESRQHIGPYKEPIKAHSRARSFAASIPITPTKRRHPQGPLILPEVANDHSYAKRACLRPDHDQQAVSLHSTGIHYDTELPCHFRTSHDC